MRAALVVLAACGAAVPVAKPPPHVADAWVYRRLTVGTVPHLAHRVTFVLTFDGARATLVETTEHAEQQATLATAEHATWTGASTVTYTGTRAAGSGDQLLDLAAPNVQPLRLRCRPVAIAVAAAGADRVPSRDRSADYTCGDRGVWDPHGTWQGDALVCAPPEEQVAPGDDDDDDDVLLFGRAPGFEHATVDNACDLRGGGIRIIP